jgi:hypothetical protein
MMETTMSTQVTPAQGPWIVGVMGENGEFHRTCADEFATKRAAEGYAASRQQQKRFLHFVAKEGR